MGGREGERGHAAHPLRASASRSAADEERTQNAPLPPTHHSVPSNFDALVAKHGRPTSDGLPPTVRECGREARARVSARSPPVFLPSPSSPFHQPAALVVTMYSTLGPSLVPHLAGGVSVALWDGASEHALASVAPRGAPTLAEARSPSGELLLAAGAPPLTGAAHPLLPPDSRSARAVLPGHAKFGWRADAALFAPVGSAVAAAGGASTAAISVPARPAPSTPRGVPAGHTPGRHGSGVFAASAPPGTPPPTPHSLADASGARRTRRGKRAGRGVRERAAAVAAYRAVTGAAAPPAVAASAPARGFVLPPSTRAAGAPLPVTPPRPLKVATAITATAVGSAPSSRADGDAWWRGTPRAAAAATPPPVAASAPAVVRFLYPQAVVAPPSLGGVQAGWRGGSSVGTGPFWPAASPPTPTPTPAGVAVLVSPVPVVVAAATVAAATATARPSPTLSPPTFHPLPPKATPAGRAADAAAVAALAAGASPRAPAPAPERARETGFAVSPLSVESGGSGTATPRDGGAPPLRPLRRVPSSLSRALAACRSATSTDLLAAAAAAAAAAGDSAPPSPLAVPPAGLPRLRLGRSASCSALAPWGAAAAAVPEAC